MATPQGRGGIGVLRLSGPAVPAIATQLLGRLPQARRATLAGFFEADGERIDQGLALYFPAPRSFTGEEVLELHGHGGPVVLEALVQRIVQLGARRARPGEFSERAYLNDKIDLAQAEAIADLIAAGSRAAARAAMRSMQGEFSASVQKLADDLAALRTQVEAAIDFADEHFERLAEAALAARLQQLRDALVRLAARAHQGRMLTRGATLVIAGPPNAGKSTLMNRLAGYDAAIVTPIAGTTRDVLRESIELDGLPVTLIDTAGLREDSTDPIEQEGIRRARAELSRADHILYVVDAAADPAALAYGQEAPSLPVDVPVTLVMNKADLVPRGARPAAAKPASPVYWIAASNGEGMDELTAAIARELGYEGSAASAFSARQRHLEILQRTSDALDAAAERLQDAQPELLAEELRQAQQALEEITGRYTTEDLLGAIFSTFCIGK